MKKLILIILSAIFALNSYTQTIRIDAPQEANKDYSFVLNKGTVSDTIKTGRFNFAGNATIIIPERYKDFTGMGSLVIAKKATYHMIVNHENFSMRISENNKQVFEGSVENMYLFDPEGRTDTDNNLYAPKFVKSLQFLTQLNKVVYSKVSLMEKAQARLYAINELDIEAIYTSGMWMHIIDATVKLAPTQADLAKNMITILKRIESEEVFIHLTENLITITQQYGWNEAFDEIIIYVKESGRIPVPTNDIYDAFNAIKVTKGAQAPTIVGLKATSKDYEHTLVVFYQEDCDICSVEMEKLSRMYDELKSKRIRIVSISSTLDSKTFKEESENLPWIDKLCDFKGFAGANFLNWGILGTPTMVYLDKDNTVIGKYALLREIPFNQKVN